MILQDVYVIARSASGRPTLQHALIDGSSKDTLCGIDMSGWSRAFTNNVIDAVFCLKCRAIKARSEIELGRAA